MKNITASRIALPVVVLLIIVALILIATFKHSTTSTTDPLTPAAEVTVKYGE